MLIGALRASLAAILGPATSEGPYPSSADVDAAVAVETAARVEALSGKVDKGSLVTSVKDFGAVGDGTTDDTAAIQNAINSLPLNPAGDGILSPLGYANGGTIYIPRGRYKVSSTLTLRRGVRITGEGRESSQLISYTADSVLKYLDSGRYAQDEIVVENLSIWQHASVTSTSGAAIEVSFGSASPPSTNLVCQNLIINGGYRGVMLGAGVWSSMDNCNVSNCVTNGVEIQLTNGAQSAPTTSTTFKNCYSSSNGAAGFRINGASYTSLVGCASDSNGTYGYHLDAGNAGSLYACGAEENTLGGAYLKNTTGAVINLNVMHTTSGVKHGVTLEACNRTTLLGGVYQADTVTGYGIHVVTNSGTITAIGAVFAGNYTSTVCDSSSKFLNLTADNGLVGGSSNNWAIGTNPPDTTATFQVGGTASSYVGLKATPTFASNPVGTNMGVQVEAQTANTAVTYALLHGVQVKNPVKGAASTITRTSGVAITEQTQGATANANLYVDAGGAIPIGNWSIYSASTRDSLFLGPIRVGSSTGPKWSSGAGTPEGAVTAPVGSIFSRTDGGAGTSMYVKETGTGNTGWVGK